MNSKVLVTSFLKGSSYCFLAVELYLLGETVYMSFKMKNHQHQESLSAVDSEIEYQELDSAMTKGESFENNNRSIAEFCVNGPEKLHKLDPALWNTALFFPDILPKALGSSTKKLIWYLSQAKRSIKLCLFSISFSPLERALEDVRKKGVTIKAVVHVPASGRRLTRRGVSTKVWKQSVISKYDPTSRIYIDLMHHKFLIIDDKYLLNGSLNWTREGITGNNENIMITSDKRAVKAFLSEFNRMWTVSEVQIPTSAWTQYWRLLKNDADIDTDKDD